MVIYRKIVEDHSWWEQPILLLLLAACLFAWFGLRGDVDILPIEVREEKRFSKAVLSIVWEDNNGGLTDYFKVIDLQTGETIAEPIENRVELINLTIGREYVFVIMSCLSKGNECSQGSNQFRYRVTH